MRTLQEAIQSGVKFNRQANLEEDQISDSDMYFDFDEYQEEYGSLSLEDITATDYILLTEIRRVAAPVLRDDLIAAAWDAARTGTVSVKPASSSPFFPKFLAELKRRVS